MRPLSDINIGDQYQASYYSGILWSVQDIDKKEKMIKIQAYSYKSCEPILGALWKKNTDNIFSRRIFNGLTNKLEL